MKEISKTEYKKCIDELIEYYQKRNERISLKEATDVIVENNGKEIFYGRTSKNRST